MYIMMIQSQKKSLNDVDHRHIYSTLYFFHFLKASRGNQLDDGIVLSEEGGSRIPNNADFFIAHSTSEGTNHA